MPASNELEFIQKIHGKLLNYLEKSKDRFVHPRKKAELLIKEFDLDINAPSSLSEMESHIDLYLESSVNTTSTRFYNQLFSGFSSMGYLGEVITGLTNHSMYTFEMSPLATLMERKLIEKMAFLIGYGDGFGTFVPGGSNANLIAMLCARERACPNSKTEGLFNTQPLVGFVSEESHYSFMKAGLQSGIGLNNIRMIPCDDHGKMNLKKLVSAIKSSIENGERPFFVGATAGTTVRGVFDPIEEIALICKQYNLWFHIDGSWGGSALISEKHRSLLKGSECSDSFTWCAHKMMGIPLMCTSIILKDKTLLKKINSVPGTDYLFHGDDDELDLGLHSLQCGRRVDSLKLWLAWKYIGDKGYENRIDHLFSLAKLAESKVKQLKFLKLLSPVESLNICFRIETPLVDENRLNELTIELRERLIAESDTLVNHASINDENCIRLIIANFDLTQEDIDKFMNNVETITQKVIHELDS